MSTSRLALALLPLLGACSTSREAGPNFDVRSEEHAQAPSSGVTTVSEEPRSPAPAPNASEVGVALFVTLEGELWTERMRRDALARLPEALASRGRIRLYPDEKLRTLGRLRNERDDLSGEWLNQVRRRLGWSPPDVLLEVTLRAGEGSARNAASGREETYPEFGVSARAVRLDGERRGESAERGHVLIHERVLNGAAQDIRALILSELMP